LLTSAPNAKSVCLGNPPDDFVALVHKILICKMLWLSGSGVPFHSLWPIADAIEMVERGNPWLRHAEKGQISLSSLPACIHRTQNATRLPSQVIGARGLKIGARGFEPPTS